MTKKMRVYELLRDRCDEVIARTISAMLTPSDAVTLKMPERKGPWDWRGMEVEVRRCGRLILALAYVPSERPGGGAWAPVRLPAKRRRKR